MIFYLTCHLKFDQTTPLQNKDGETEIAAPVIQEDELKDKNIREDQEDNQLQFDDISKTQPSQSINVLSLKQQYFFFISNRKASELLMNSSFENLIQNDDEEEEIANFFKREKVFLILTNAGKPVYSSYGDIYQLSPIIATLYAMLSKVCTFELKPEPNKLEQMEIEERMKNEEANRLSTKVINTKLGGRISQALKRIKEEEREKQELISLLEQSLFNLLEQKNPEEAARRQQVKEEEQFKQQEQQQIIPDEQLKTKILGMSSMTKFPFQVAFLQKSDCLLYIALSKTKNESQTFLKRQLEMLHAYFIKTLKINPSYDVITDVFDYRRQINCFVKNMSSDPATFLNQYLPLRVHPKVRRAITTVINKVKPQGVHNSFYYGLLLAERTVVHTIKSDPRISIMASDNQLPVKNISIF